MSEITQSNRPVAKSGGPKPMLSLILALAASLIAWGFVKTKHPMFLVPEEYHITALGPPLEKVQALEAQQFRVDRWNTALFMAVLGGPLAVGLAVGAAACCATWLRILVALPWGVLWGAATGFVAALVVQKYGQPAQMPTVTDVAKEQGLLFALLGTGVGLLIGGFGRSARTILTGTLGGAVTGGVAALAFSIVTSLAMPAEGFSVFIPTGLAARVLWLGLPCACLGYVVPLITSPPPSSAPSMAEGDAAEGRP